MSTGGASEEIKRFPENYEDMVKKLQDREEEQLKKLLEKRNVATFEELQGVAKKAIVQRSLRVAGEHETLKSHTILFEPKAEDIKTLRQKLNQEISAYVKAVFQQNPELKKSGGLKGRVSIRSSEEKVPEYSGESH